MMDKNKPTRETIIRTVALFIVLLNQVVVLFGGNAIPYSENQIYEAVSTGATVSVSLLSWWYNNSFSEAAIEADFLKNMIKNECSND